MAFKMNGFPSHKGTQQHVGTRKGSAVFQKASAFKDDGHGGEPGHEHNITWGDWKEGETKTTKEGGTTRKDTRTGVIAGTDDYDGSGGYMSNEDWKAFLETPEGQEYLKRTGDREVGDERTIETPPAPVEKTYGSLSTIKDPAWGRHSGPSITASTGLKADPSGLLGMKVDGEYYYFPEGRGGGVEGRMMEDLKRINPEAYEDAMQMAVESGYRGGRQLEGGGWDMTDYTSAEARNPGETPAKTALEVHQGLGRSRKQMRENPTASVAGPEGYVEERDGPVGIELQYDPSVFQKKKHKKRTSYKKLGGNRTKSWI